jgi:hypothetical protein
VNRAKLLHLCNGNTDAVAFIEAFYAFCVVWDDAVDRDKDTVPERVNNAMMWSLFGLHDNAFYRANMQVLRAAMAQAIASWMVANKFEKSKDTSLVEQAYFMRCSPYDVFSTVVLLTSGFDKQLEAVEFFRSLAPEDSLTNFMFECLGD